MSSDAARRWGLRHLDEILALVVLVWGVTATVARHTQKGPLVLNLLVVVGLAAAMLVRRRRPLVFTAVTLGLALVSRIWLDDNTRATWSIYILVVPPYSVAAYLELRQAVVGLVIAAGAAAAIDASHAHVFREIVFTTILAVGAWTTGRAMRHRRALAVELGHRTTRLAAEREDRARLAVADERSRIARELHAVVANSISAMVVQAEAAQRLVDHDLPAADGAMDEIESTGREALAEMRRILGVLRRSDGVVDLAPQPGVGQIHTLVEQARAAGRQVGLRVEGEPGPLPVAVDLAVYRVVEEALEGSAGDAGVLLRFNGQEVVLEVSRTGSAGESWPTVAMSERVALCEGSVFVEAEPDDGERLVVRLPQSFEVAFV